MKTYFEYKALISRLEYAIFGSPEASLGFGGWVKHHDKMQTRLRPDGSDGGRPDKTTLKFIGDSLFLSYNGSQFTSAYVTKILKDKYGKGWVKTTCDLYGITADDRTVSSSPKEYRQPTKAKTFTIGDESQVDCIPQKIVSPTYDRSRHSVLRSFLNETFGEDATLQAWERYRVGDAYGGQTIFWDYDKQGRCRGGKMMAYHPDGHRDKKNPYSTISIGADLKRLGHIEAETKLIDCVFGENLLAQYPNSPVGVVESEKSALVCSIVFPSAVWIATGGIGQKIDRAIALLRGRKVTVFPDADGVEEWKAKFGKVRGFTVDALCRDYFTKKGEKWAKCDLCDILIEEYHKEPKEA